MRKWILPILLILSLVLPLSARAQTPLTFDLLQLQIWPEYDKPAVLVIYQMTLPSAASLPATVAVRIPAAAGDPNAVAVHQADGSLITLDYNRTVSGEWATISFTTPGPEVQLEYYDPTLEINGNSRHFQYTWPGDYAASQFTIQVQQPVDSTDMVISPSLGSGATGNDGLTYYTQDIGAIPAGQEINITIDYNKSTDTLSATTISVQPSAPIPQSKVTDLNISAWLPWILGILGAGLIIGGIIWFWQSGRQRPASRNRRRRSRAGTNEPASNVVPAEDAIYCSQCGKRASPGDQYCRSCGTQIRTR